VPLNSFLPKVDVLKGLPTGGIVAKQNFILAFAAPVGFPLNVVGLKSAFNLARASVIY
jgi:hypothetical protein